MSKICPRNYAEICNDTTNLEKRILEDGIYGADALKYASQITAINLALMSDTNLERQNIRTVYLGYMKETQPPLSWLGSLELLNNGKRFLGLVAWMNESLEV
ncbi:MAG: hypothetical protein ACRDF4_05780, partial [Rhabdochlamydiaceae bacterium]